MIYGQLGTHGGENAYFPDTNTVVVPFVLYETETQIVVWGEEGVEETI